MITSGYINPESIFVFTVSESDNKCRIDRYIANLFPDYSRNYFQNIIASGSVSLNDIIVKKPSSLVYSTDTVSIQFPPERILDPNYIIDRTNSITIIAETNHFIAIHKPASLLVHPPSSRSNAITVVDWIRHHYKNISDVGTINRPGIIHRLDRETSGILLITKTNYAHNAIGILFKERQMNKIYKAIVEGHPPREGTILFGIGRNPLNRLKMTHFNPDLIDDAGNIGNTKVRTAKTEYKVLEYFENATLIEVKPTTGRTHQIRVHMAAIGHPVIGDQLYGKKSSLIDRQALHAESLAFDFDGKKYLFTDTIPSDFQKLINHLHTHSAVKQ